MKSYTNNEKERTKKAVLEVLSYDVLMEYENVVNSVKRITGFGDPNELRCQFYFTCSSIMTTQMRDIDKTINNPKKGWWIKL